MPVQGPPRQGGIPGGSVSRPPSALPALANLRWRPCARQHFPPSGHGNQAGWLSLDPERSQPPGPIPGTNWLLETWAGRGLSQGVEGGGKGLSLTSHPQPPSPQVPGQAVISWEHLRGGDVREAQGPDPEAGADVQAEPGGDGLGAPRRPARH